jgi:hypothetical protein
MVTGSQLFADYVYYLYDFKKQGIRAAKNLLNCLWGALCQQNLYTFIHDIEKHGDYEPFENTEILEVIPLNNEYTKVKITQIKKNSRFETNFARINPFLMAKCRSIMAKTIQPYVEHVKFCHTDSMISDIELPIKTGDELGDLAYEGFCENTKIMNKNKKTGEYLI